MLGRNKGNQKQVVIAMTVILAIATVFSVVTTTFAQDSNEEVASIRTMSTAKIKGSENIPNVSVKEFLVNIWKNTGINQLINGVPKTAPYHCVTCGTEEIVNYYEGHDYEVPVCPTCGNKMTEKPPVVAEDPFAGLVAPGWQKLLMMAIGFLIIYLGAFKGFEPLLLIPIGFGTVLVNIPGAGMFNEGTGMLRIIYDAGVGNEFFPMLIFMGIGAMTDFGPLIANPKMALLGGAAQLGVFFTLFGVALMNLIPGVDYTMLQACAIAIIGGADGPTSIYVSGKLAPEMMAVIAVAAYSYMALVPMIQPPLMKMLTTEKERKIKMKQLRYVSKTEKIVFPIVLLILTILLLPSAAPLIGMLAFGNFVKQCGVVDRLAKTMENELLNIVSILLSLGVGSQMTPEKIMNPNSLGIIALGLFAFAIATLGGLLMAKIMNLFLKEKINPLIGSAGVSAVPMAARVANKVGMEYDPSNFLLMHAMGPNVSGVIGTAIAAGVFIATYAH